MDDAQKVKCYRCGFAWNVAQQKRGKKDLLCASCRAKPASIIQYGSDKCIPWSGDFDSDNVTPLLNNEPYLPGKRICGHSDCVAVNHIERGQ